MIIRVVQNSKDQFFAEEAARLGKLYLVDRKVTPEEFAEILAISFASALHSMAQSNPQRAGMVHRGFLQMWTLLQSKKHCGIELNQAPVLLSTYN
jgi:hypothetical protein